VIEKARWFSQILVEANVAPPFGQTEVDEIVVVSGWPWVGEQRIDDLVNLNVDYVEGWHLRLEMPGSAPGSRMLGEARRRIGWAANNESEIVKQAQDDFVTTIGWKYSGLTPPPLHHSLA
jgi:hypothetical protein